MKATSKVVAFYFIFNLNTLKQNV